MPKLIVMQLGKQGLTENFFLTLENHFKNHDNVKISVLKSAGHDKTKVKKIAQQIVDSLGKNYTFRIIGFTIALKKWGKDRR